MFIETHSVHINRHTLRKAHHSVAGIEYPRTLSAIPFAYQRTLSSSNTRSKRPSGGQLTPCTQQNAFGLLVNILGNPSVDFRRLSDRLKQHKLKTKDSDERLKRKTQTKDPNERLKPPNDKQHTTNSSRTARSPDRSISAARLRPCVAFEDTRQITLANAPFPKVDHQ